MDTDTVRLNIILPKDIALTLKKMTSPRKRSRYIAEAIRQQIEQQKKEELKKILERGYKANRNESLVVAKEFEAADLEGWDEY
jgi:metal-responsive CopG/Arc/MetJ family transcriptional regulator